LIIDLSITIIRSIALAIRSTQISEHSSVIIISRGAAKIAISTIGPNLEAVPIALDP
jgi:hypothetical protein